LRIRAHAFLRNAVVAGEHDHRRTFHRGVRCTLDQPHLARERLEPAKTAGRLGLGIDDVLQFGTQREIQRFDFGQSLQSW
jgi:hypothetical protein